MTSSLKQFSQTIGQRFKTFSLVSVSAAVLSVSLPSHAGIISSSLGNALHVDLQLLDLPPLIVELGKANGTAPSSFNEDDSLVNQSFNFPTEDFGSDAGFASTLGATLFGANAKSTLENSSLGFFETIGSSTIDGLALSIFQSIIPGIPGFPPLDFISLSSGLIKSTSEINAEPGTDGFEFSNSGSTLLKDLSINILGNSIDVSVLDNAPIMDNLEIFNDLGLFIIANEVISTCDNTVCSEDRSALRISFKDFSIQNYADRFLSERDDIVNNNFLITGDIVLARSQASAQVSEPSAAIVMALGLILIGRCARSRRKQ